MLPSHSVAGSRGLTVFEVVVGASALAIVALGLLAWMGPGSETEKSDEAVRTASTIGNAVDTWQKDNGQNCPTISQLQHERYLSLSARAEDPWGNRFRIVCEGATVMVTSAGKDHEPRTPDDVEVPIS